MAKKEIIYKTDEEIELIRQSCILVCKTIAYVGELIKPGVTGKYLDEKAEQFILDNNALPGFKGYRDYPNTLTVSINEQIVHGIPSDKVIKEGDVVSVDCGVLMNGYYGDAAYTYVLQGADEKAVDLCRTTLTSLYKGIEKANVGGRMGDIGHAIFDYCSVKHKYSVIRELVGHGLGKNMHEEPNVKNIGKKGEGIVLKDGLVIAIEPMVNMGLRDIVQLADEWTIISKDRKPAAHYEHTIALRKGKEADILSDHSFIEEIVKNNANLVEISRKN